MKTKYKVTFKYECIIDDDFENPAEQETTIIIEAHDIREAFEIVMKDEFYSEVSNPDIASIVREEK